MDIKKHFDEIGYLVIPNLLSEEECTHYKSLLERDVKQYTPHYATTNAANDHGLANKSAEKVVFNLHNKDLSWFKLFEHPEITKILEVILVNGSYMNSHPYYMYTNSARCPLKGNKGQQLHIDSGLPGINYCIVANVLWVLDDFTDQNGATRIYPGSHKFTQFAEDGRVYDEEILVTTPKGSAIIFDANLWHGGGPNHDGASRWAATLGYARWFHRPAFDYMQNTPEEIYNQLTDSQKRLLGFNVVSPKDEFTRVRRRTETFETPQQYELPNK